MGRRRVAAKNDDLARRNARAPAYQMEPPITAPGCPMQSNAQNVNKNTSPTQAMLPIVFLCLLSALVFAAVSQSLTLWPNAGSVRALFDITGL